MSGRDIRRRNTTHADQSTVADTGRCVVSMEDAGAFGNFSGIRADIASVLPLSLSVGGILCIVSSV